MSFESIYLSLQAGYVPSGLSHLLLPEKPKEGLKQEKAMMMKAWQANKRR